MKTHNDMTIPAAAFTCASVGNKDRAFARLDKAVEQRNWCITYLKADPVWTRCTPTADSKTCCDPSDFLHNSLSWLARAKVAFIFVSCLDLLGVSLPAQAQSASLNHNE